MTEKTCATCKHWDDPMISEHRTYWPDHGVCDAAPFYDEDRVDKAALPDMMVEDLSGAGGALLTARTHCCAKHEGIVSGTVTRINRTHK